MQGVAEKVKRRGFHPQHPPNTGTRVSPRDHPGHARAFTAGCHTPGCRVPGSQSPRGTPMHSRRALTRQAVRCRLRSPDLDGRAAEHLPVAVPAAAGGAAAAGGGVLAAQRSQPLLPAAQHAAVLVLRGLRHKLELLDAIDFHEGEVKLARDSQTGTHSQRRCAGGMTTVRGLPGAPHSMGTREMVTTTLKTRSHPHSRHLLKNPVVPEQRLVPFFTFLTSSTLKATWKHCWARS